MQNYTRVAVSKDGSTLLATAFYGPSPDTNSQQGGVLLSTDAGNTWSTVPNIIFDYPSGAAGLGVILQPLALSKDGSVMVVGSPQSQLWLSTDKGATFVDIVDRIAAADAVPNPAATAAGTTAASTTPSVKVGCLQS